MDQVEPILGIFFYLHFLAISAFFGVIVAYFLFVEKRKNPSV